MKVSVQSPLKKIPPFLGKDLGGPYSEEVMKREPIYVHWSSSGPVRVLDSRGQVFAGFLETRYITI